MMTTPFPATPVRAAAAVLTVLGLCLALTVLAAPAAHAQYGPYACTSGYVWREAYDGDVVCVTPASRDTARAERLAGPRNKVEGSRNCRSGYVWREARPDDLVCVSGAPSPTPRDRVRGENADAVRHLADAGAVPTGRLSIDETRPNTYLNVDAVGSGATPGGTVTYYMTPSPGSVQLLGSVTASGSGTVNGRLLSTYCPRWRPYSVPVVALDVKTGAVTRSPRTTSLNSC